jgi:hypothetical protein
MEKVCHARPDVGGFILHEMKLGELAEGADLIGKLPNIDQKRPSLTVQRDVVRFHVSVSLVLAMDAVHNG